MSRYERSGNAKPEGSGASAADGSVSSRWHDANPVYEDDERGLFCRHCGRATWLHLLVRGRGYVCTTSPEVESQP